MAEINTLLEKQGWRFTAPEFEEAFTGLLANSSTGDEAALIREIKGWWDILRFSAGG